MRETMLALRLSRRELRSGLKGFYIFLLCLILGVGAIASVRSLSSGMLDTLHANGRYILGGDIALRTMFEPATPEQISYLNREIGLTTVVAETRAMARTADESNANLVELKAIDIFYPLYGDFVYRDIDGNLRRENKNLSEDLLATYDPETQQDGDDWGAFIEPELTDLIGVDLGDDIVIGDQTFTIRGIIEQEPDRLGGQRFSYAPRVMISRNAFDLTGLNQTGSQIEYFQKVLLSGDSQYENLAAVQQQIEEAFPDANWRGRNYFNASPTIERFVETLTLFLSLVGLTALLVGGVGIGNAVRSYLEEKYSNIATLKCLGASRRLVFKTYFFQVMIIGAIGTAIGCLIGAVVPFIVAPFLTEKLALSHNLIGFYPMELLLAAGFGLLTVACFSLYPIGRACEVRAADLFRSAISLDRKWPSINTIVGVLIAAQALALLAIISASDKLLASGFVGGTLVTIAIFLAVAALIKLSVRGLRHTPVPALRFAIANLYRPGNITNNLVLSLGLGLTIFVAIGLVEYNFSQKLQDNLERDMPSFFLLDIQSDQAQPMRDLLNATPTARNLRMLPMLQGQITHVNDIPAEEAFIEGSSRWVLSRDRRMTYTGEAPPHSEITDGEWWDADYDGPPIVSISTEVAEAFDIGAGANMTINIMGMNIEATVANIREIDWGSFAMNFAMTFAPGTLESAPATYVATISMDKSAEMDAQAQIARDFPNVSAIRIRDALNLANTILAAIAEAVRYSAAITLLAGVLVLAGAIAAGQKRRIYDAVVFKVLGVDRKQLMRVFLTEYFVLGLITALVACLIGTVCAWAIQTYIMQMDWAFSLTAVLYVALGALTLSILFGMIATWRILGVRPAPYLRND